MSQGAAAAEYSAVIMVNDEDYGYWEGKLKAFLDGEQTALDELASPIVDPVTFEVSHDLVRGLVRQFVPRPADSNVDQRATMSEASDAASAAAPSQPPVGEGSWVRFGNFYSFGFGQYEGSDVSYVVYCDSNPRVSVWLVGGSIEGLSPNDAADRVLKDDHGKAQIELGCEGGMEISN
jgi:hypothetical protein